MKCENTVYAAHALVAVSKDCLARFTGVFIANDLGGDACPSGALDPARLYRLQCGEQARKAGNWSHVSRVTVDTSCYMSPKKVRAIQIPTSFSHATAVRV